MVDLGSSHRTYCRWAILCLITIAMVTLATQPLWSHLQDNPGAATTQDAEETQAPESAESPTTDEDEPSETPSR